ncbi:hypothetical protein B0J14DRAFT_579812 [Halenospora varia]|nr:hypothetical protein B0J14DRAFT_579812 [Halenospora varia]
MIAYVILSNKISLFLNLVLNPSPEPLGPIPHPPICQPKALTLTRDQRRDCQLLHSIGWSYRQIHTHTRRMIRQIGSACAKATPKKSSGRPPLLTQAQVKELVEFVCVSSENRQMSFRKLTEVLDFEVKKQANCSALL